ncbi:MAG TPA: membrane protein insertase YidC [Cyanobacteria bacterium UBA11149]|nr:membrane protein insertase YidC [Cyanobacteria bacterium UBA11367]HBE59444.1 membrane protein insertase YidC [Cyanobacteria bacterium UBA11366]HBR76334.1 membrane protein insertase YidC [Cyanobacteria bacterium UBA11159]HBS72449.1 membrane protein insertase YidC [Cyanobacteria bacterium UBA11153]HBW89889.1 membrane protein insertase YidC [Cyanobacteria bacterium UBA11149]HCA97602.1 membrane protein insertase YidC [Cyanobacteria bacterium UBA9226]
MDFGIGFLSNNVMLPILDLFYGIVPSYGLAIVALTLVIRFALYPLNAGSIRNMRRMKITQPLMKKRQEEIQKLYANDKVKQQEEMSKLFQEFGNPLAGCLPVLLQMPVLFALFATLRGSPFSDVNYPVNIQILPREQMELVQPQAFATKPQNIYIADGVHAPVAAIIPGGNRLIVGEKTQIEFKTTEGKAFTELLADYPDTEIVPKWTITKGADLIKINEDGTLEAIAPGDVTLTGTITGLASNRGFLFIDALGRVGAFEPDGTIHWDIVGMILFFGVSLYINQVLTGQNNNNDPASAQQNTVNKITPVIFSGMFFFFPLPAGVLMYMVIANIFQTAQSFILMREPLPENIQKMVEEQEKEAKLANREALPFEPKAAKKEEKPTEKRTAPASQSKGVKKEEKPRAKPTTQPSQSQGVKKQEKPANRRDSLPFENKRSKKKP